MPVSTIGTNSLASTAQIGSLTTASGSAPSYSARAWVNFNGTGTVAIRASGNVSSITDNGVGDYTVNFTTALSSVDYAVTGTIGNSGQAGQVQTDNAAGTFSVNSIRLAVQVGVSRTDNSTVQIAVFR